MSRERTPETHAERDREYNKALLQVSELQDRVRWLETFVRTNSHNADIRDVATGTELAIQSTTSQAPNVTTTSPATEWFMPLILRDGQEPRTSLPTMVDLLPFEQALEHARIYLARFVLPHHNTDQEQLEEDLTLVYADGQRNSPYLAASRFRSHLIVYINILMKRRPENENSATLSRICRSVGMNELGKLLIPEDIVSRHHDQADRKTAAQALSFVGIMALHEPGGPSFYQVVGFAARIAMSIKLHRHSALYLQTLSTVFADQAAADLHEQRRRRIFWAIYALDRLAVFNLNLPPSLRDSDIDIEVSPDHFSR